jgi:SOS-response transcriptional repressor LexA
MPAAQTVEESENAKAILAFLERHAQTHQLPPSRKEIADATGIGSTGTVQRWLKRLQAHGLIRMESDKARAVFLNTARASRTKP